MILWAGTLETGEFRNKVREYTFGYKFKRSSHENCCHTLVDCLRNPFDRSPGLLALYVVFDGSSSFERGKENERGRGREQQRGREGERHRGREGVRGSGRERGREVKRASETEREGEREREREGERERG